MSESLRVRTFAAFILLTAVTGSTFGQVNLEYVGHACFRLTSPAGVKIVIDPFNGERWLGYHFPEDLEADAVLISHPHYDHDAGYYFDSRASVFRKPGRYQLGDVRFTGIEGFHAQPYGADFGRTNTIWLVEVGGLRLVHWGDNGPINEALLRQIQPVDIAFLPIDSTFHILKEKEIDEIRKALSPVIVIPMHYWLPLAPAMDDLGPIDPWLEKVGGRRLKVHASTLTRENLPRESGVMALEAWPSLRAWDDSLKQAWQEASLAGRAMESDQPDGPLLAKQHIQRAADLAPTVLIFQWGMARALSQAGMKDQAASTLERALSGSLQQDWEYRIRSHALLAQLYAQAGDQKRAQQHYRIVLHQGFRERLLTQAREFLEKTQ